MGKTMKKLLSAVLSIVMVISLLPSFSLTAAADQVQCPNCGSTDLDNYGGNSYFCNACGEDFTLPGPPCPNCQSTNTTQISADRYFGVNCDEDFQYIDPNDTVEGDGTQNNPYLVGSLASFQRVCSQWYEDDPVYIKLKDDITFGTATFFISCNVNLDLDNCDIGEDQTTRFGISEDNTLNITGATGRIYSLQANYGATVILTSGTIENIDLEDGSKFVMNGGCVSDEIECNEDTTTTINGGTVEEIFTNFNADVVINNVTTIGNLLINGESTVTIYDGAIRDLKLDDECRCTVNGGSFTQSSSVLDGGTLEVTLGDFSGPWGGILNNGGNVVISGGNFGYMLNNSGTTALSGGNFEKTNDYGDDEQGYLENLTAPGFMVIEGNTYFTVVPSHTITWKKDENTVIDTTEVEVGKTPAHADPEGYEDADYTYTFAGWTPSIVAATADATYTATFTATPKTPAHVHSFTYAAGTGDNAKTVTATCTADGCTDPAYSVAMSIVAPALTTYGGAESAAATLDGAADFNTATGLSVSADSIGYYKAVDNSGVYSRGEALAAAPTAAGTYWAEITVSNAAAYVVYTIAKADPTYTAPTGLEATYGATLSSVSLPNGWEWEDAGTTPVGDVGSNVFKAKFTPDDTDNYNVVEHVDVTVSVGKAASVAASVAANEWTFDGTTKPLLTVTGEAAGGAMKYATGTATQPGTFGDTIPEASAADTYYVWYMVAGDANHNDTDAVLVTVTVAHDEELDAVIAAIDAIGPVTEVTDTIKTNIKTARDGYNDLTPAQQALVTNYATLVDAEADFAALFVFADETEISISGTERYGETLTATATDVPAFITDAVVRWYNDNNELLGTGETYTLTAAEIGKSVRAELYSAEANDSVWSDFTAIVGKGVIKNYTLPTAAHIMYPQTLAEATLTGGDTGDVEGVWAWVIPDAQPTSAQSGSSFELTFTPAGVYADLYEGFTTRLAVVVDPAPFEPQSIEDTASGLTFDAEFAQNVEIELTDIAYSQSAYLALLRASKKDDSGMTRLVLLKTIVFTVDGEEADEAYNGAVTVTSYVGAKLAGQTVSVWFFIDGEPVNYVGTVGYDGVLVIDNVAL